jgi:hypothetical protein
MSGDKFKVGDRVTFTNDQGCVFPGKTVIGTEPDRNGQTRYHLTPTDTPWFAFAGRNLTPEEP